MTAEPRIHSSALPNDLSPTELRLRPDAGGAISVEPARAGWRYLSFRAFAAGTDDAKAVGRPETEAVLVVLGGGAADVVLESGERIDLPGRASPFEDLPWAAYLPAGTRATVCGRPFESSGTVMIAIAEAPVRASGNGSSAQPIRISPEDVAVEIRGAGNASRQINHIVAPGFPADRLLVVEVLTPAGNWSSWPPHKHDVDDMPAEAVLEEVYYYRLRRPDGWGIQRLYRSDGTRDGLWAVRDGELVIVPDGYHPFVAAHGYDAYYLNALAGDRRTMACSFDPSLDWTRSAWADLAPDPRLPLVEPRGWPRPIDQALAAGGSTWTTGRPRK